MTATEESPEPTVGRDSSRQPVPSLTHSEQRSPVETAHPSPHEQVQGLIEEKEKEDREVMLLRQALEAAEEQTQLINTEYGKLLREKEVCLCVCVCMWCVVYSGPCMLAKVPTSHNKLRHESV